MMRLSREFFLIYLIAILLINISHKLFKKKKNLRLKTEKFSFSFFYTKFRGDGLLLSLSAMGRYINSKRRKSMDRKVFLFLMLLLAGCESIGLRADGEGVLRIAFASDVGEMTRSATDVPDTSDFILTVTDSQGKVIYSGAYGDCPESMSVAAGNYVVKALSSEFSKPEFSSPQYGDEQCVVVPDGSVADVRLVCRQMNSGVRLRIAKDFLTKCPDGVLFLKSDQGKLMYGYSEKRIAYFLPGNVSLILSENGKDQVLMSRTLLAQEVLSLGVSVASSGASSTGSHISVAVDTTRNWVDDAYVIGGQGTNGSDMSDAMTVSAARSSAGSKDVWVCGYIVGGDLTSANASFDEPFTSRTNILLGPKSSTSDRDACLSVQLSAGDMRDELNLVDNPGYLHRKIYLRGDLVDAYYGIPGMKNISQYSMP